MIDSSLQCEPELSVSELPFPQGGLKAIFKPQVPPRANRNTPAEAPWIEYVAGQWVVVKRRRDVPPERRSFHAMRKHIDKLLDLGWSITGRDPVRLEFQHRVKIVKGGQLIDG
ncbi:hypothetical protein ACFPU0_15745 [Pseudomonas sp. GCM10022186]|uniref:hypothetical protein n=1 Tax=Pseudomonas sp. GCM10022186 TaxID=3252650 RepID=UPI003623F60F